MTTFDRTPTAFPFSQVPHGLWTCGLSAGATRLLGWLWSHDPEFLRRMVTLRYAQHELGGRIRDQIRELDEAGYLSCSSEPGKGARIVLNGDAWTALGARTSVRGTANIGARDREQPCAVPRTSVRTEKNSENTSENTSEVPSVDADASPADETPVELTSGQRANRIMRAMFDGIKQHTGRAFTGIQPVALQRILTPLIDAGWSDDEVRVALREVYKAAAPITRATIEAELDGRRRARRPAGNKVGQLAGLRFDESGKLVG